MHAARTQQHTHNTMHNNKRAAELDEVEERMTRSRTEDDDVWIQAIENQAIDFHQPRSGGNVEAAAAAAGDASDCESLVSVEEEKKNDEEAPDDVAPLLRSKGDDGGAAFFFDLKADFDVNYTDPVIAVLRILKGSSSISIKSALECAGRGLIRRRDEALQFASSIQLCTIESTKSTQASGHQMIARLKEYAASLETNASFVSALSIDAQLRAVFCGILDTYPLASREELWTHYRATHKDIVAMQQEVVVPSPPAAAVAAEKATTPAAAAQEEEPRKDTTTAATAQNDDTTAAAPHPPLRLQRPPPEFVAGLSSATYAAGIADGEMFFVAVCTWRIPWANVEDKKAFWPAWLALPGPRRVALLEQHHADCASFSARLHPCTWFKVMCAEDDVQLFDDVFIPFRSNRNKEEVVVEDGGVAAYLICAGAIRCMDKWVQRNGYPPNTQWPVTSQFASACELAARADQLRMLRVLHRRGGWPITPLTMDIAAVRGNAAILNYLITAEPSMAANRRLELTRSAAMSLKSTACLQLLVDRGLAMWHESIVAAAVSAGSVACLRYALDKGCKWDPMACVVASMTVNTASAAANVARTAGMRVCMDVLRALL